MRLHRAIGLIFAAAFAIVGLNFLFMPERVIILFNDLSYSLDLPLVPPFVPGIYHILAAAYMYVVTLLAFFMWRRPRDTLPTLLLANAKLASAALSLGAFFTVDRYLIFLANGVVDGLIGVLVLILYFRISKGAGNLRLALLNTWMPAFVRSKKLRELSGITARAFGSEAPDLDGLPIEMALKRYAEFTSNAVAETSRDRADLAVIEGGLFTGARDFGRRLRRELRIVDDAQFALACKILYQAIGIDLKIESKGELVIGRCFFADYYSSEVCRVMSSADDGLVTGLSGGTRLTFSQRITEGNDQCRGVLTLVKGDS